MTPDDFINEAKLPPRRREGWGGASFDAESALAALDAHGAFPMCVKGKVVGLATDSGVAWPDGEVAALGLDPGNLGWIENDGTGEGFCAVLAVGDRVVLWYDMSMDRWEGWM